jgi:transcriptional regulator with XRE-family HTH domain
VPPTTHPLPRAKPPDTNKELANVVRAWRWRLDPSTLPNAFTGIAALRPDVVSQERVAGLIGCSLHHYRKLEQGKIRNYGGDFLNRVARTLQLDADETTVLFMLATGHPPFDPPPSPSFDITPAVRRFLDAQPWPAYVKTTAWDLLAWNDVAQQWFPTIDPPKTNLVMWTFTDPHAREQLYDWETDWAPGLIGQLRFAQARMPDDIRLAEVIAAIRKADKTAKRLWDEPVAAAHADGSLRKIQWPGSATPQLVELVALEPLRTPGIRVMQLIPVAER